MAEEFEFDDDYNDEEVESNVVTLNDLKGLKVNKEQDEQAKAESRTLLEKGEWRKVDHWEPKVTFDSADKRIGDISESGRCIINMYGKVVKDGKEGFIGFTFSPDYRPKDAEPKYRFFHHQLWLRALDLYKKRYEHAAEEVIDVVNMLANDQYLLNVDVYNNYNNVKSFK